MLKYIVHCKELNITTYGTERMAEELKKFGYKKAKGSAINSCLNGKCNTHLDLTFSCEIIEDYKMLSPISRMSLLDIVEMLADWKSASMRHATGDIFKSIEVNQKRYGYTDELKQIFINTVKKYF